MGPGYLVRLGCHATGPGMWGSNPRPPDMVAVTMHVHGKRPVSELASVLTELDRVDAVVAANPQPADE